MLPAPEVLGETSPGLQKSLRNFIGYFWAPFGRLAARKLAEEKRAKVFVVFVVVVFPFPCLLRSYGGFYCSVKLILWYVL